jgi:hypothetical protein
MYLTRHLVTIFAILAGLVGCQTTAPIPPAASVDKFVPLMINARRLEIIDNWRMPVEAPYIGYRAQTFPSKLLANWAAKVLLPAGGSGELVFDISRASVTRIALPMKADIENLLTDQQENKIKAELEVKIMWLQPVGGSQALVKLRADHSLTIPESATTNGFKNAIQEALMGALTALDQQARIEIAKIDKIVLP